MSLARKQFTEFKERAGHIADTELDDFWAALQPATIDGMIGEWKGGEFVTGHKMNGQLAKAGWFGIGGCELLRSRVTLMCSKAAVSGATSSSGIESKNSRRTSSTCPVAAKARRRPAL